MSRAARESAVRAEAAVHHWFEPFHRLMGALADFVFPPACNVCRRELTEDPSRPESGAALRLCAGCLDAFRPPLDAWWCRRCGAVIGPYSGDAKGCHHCRDSRFAFERAFALGVYRGHLRSTCLRAKEPGQESVAASLGRLLGRVWRPELLECRPDLVIPIPQHWSQRLTRQHNPAEVIGRVLAEELRIEFEPCQLVKTRRTVPQKTLPPSRRRANLRGAFTLRAARRLEGRRVLLVDDVLTTGTTAHRSARLLRQAGAETIMVAVLARGLGDARDTA
jgi:ComF family protein